MLKLPSHARVRSRKDPSMINRVKIANTFKQGEPVTVELGYNTKYRREFKGFVYRVSRTVPCEIELEGYSYELKRNKVNKYWKATTLKEIMAEAVKGTSITVTVADDMPIVNYMARNVSGAELLDDIIEKVSDRAITAFFIEPDRLWVGLTYTAYLKTVKFRVGYNIINADKLKDVVAEKTLVEIKYVHKKPTGEKVKAAAKNGVGIVKQKALTSVGDASWLQKLADAKLKRVTYDGIDGKAEAFLWPYLDPGDKAIIDNPVYSYVTSNIIESVEVRFGIGGARRIFETGITVN
jgi:hypothetical protein